MNTPRESQQIGKTRVRNESEASPPRIIQRQRNVGLALSALLSSVGFMTGCNSPQPGTETSKQKFGCTQGGYTHYQDYQQNGGWVSVGNRSFLFSDGNQSESEQPVRPTLTREELMALVECYHLTPDEAAQLGHAYEAMRVFDSEHEPPAPIPNEVNRN